jgi:hypothetical protein
MTQGSPPTPSPSNPVVDCRTSDAGGLERDRVRPTPEVCQGPWPADHLVQDCIELATRWAPGDSLRATMSVKRESPTRFDVAYPEFTHHSTQVLDGRSAADVAVAGEPGRLVQGGRDRVLVLRGHEHETVEGGELGEPVVGQRGTAAAVAGSSGSSTREGPRRSGQPARTSRPAVSRDLVDPPADGLADPAGSVPPTMMRTAA